MSYVEMVLGGTTLASRVYDVRRAVSFLERFEGAAGTVVVHGTGIAALWGYLAGALDERIRGAHLSGMLPSWTEIVETRLYDSDTITAALASPPCCSPSTCPTCASATPAGSWCWTRRCPSPPSRSSCPSPATDGGRCSLRGEASPGRTTLLAV